MTDDIRQEILEMFLKGNSPEKLIEENLPRYLYKYRAGKDWDLDALENDSIWIANATLMDDPSDSKLLLTEEFRKKIENIVNNIDRFKEEKYKRHLDDKTIQRECYLCSFSELSDSEDMWERYADYDRGFCIEYDARKLLAKINLPIFPVCYSGKEYEDEKTISVMTKSAIIFKNFLIKDKVGKNGEDWYSQREWRIIAFRKNIELSENEKNGKCIDVIKPTKIILGKYVSDVLKSRIMKWQKSVGNEDIIIVQK